ncbi:MAG: hypothetical protein FWF81_02015 [Defluviitaleaceae bacterium]|nr:hypothetical protein [Defluviitaleaceae bacterium]
MIYLDFLFSGAASDITCEVLFPYGDSVVSGVSFSSSRASAAMVWVSVPLMGVGF